MNNTKMKELHLTDFSEFSCSLAPRSNKSGGLCPRTKQFCQDPDGSALSKIEYGVAKTIPECQKQHHKADISVCRSIPCVRGISYGRGKTDNSGSDAENDDSQKLSRETGDEQICTVWPGCGHLGCQLVKIKHRYVEVSHLRWPWREG